MEKIEDLVPGLARAEQRLPMLVLYGLYQAYIDPGLRRPGTDAYLARYQTDFQHASVETMIAHLLLAANIPWPLEVLARTRDDYYAQRRRRRGVLLPAVFEAALALAIAEAYRSAGEEDRARQYISE